MARDLSRAQSTWMKNNRCPLCGKFIWYTHDYLDGERVDGIRWRPLSDPAAMTECPKCGGRWFAYDRKSVDIIEGERTTEVAAQQELVLDNLHGSSPLRRTKEISREWSQELEVTVEESSSEQLGMQIGKKDVATLTAMVENALKTTYRVVAESRRSYTDTLEFEVPAGTLRTVTLTFRRMWQSGEVCVAEADGTVNKYPFRVIDGLELDVKQDDTTG